MPPPLLIDLSKIDTTGEPIYGRKDIDPLNPQRYEMEHLDGILWEDVDKRLVLGYCDISDKEFWIKGHIPGRPLMPAVIMIEAAAQMYAFWQGVSGSMSHLPLAGVEGTKVGHPGYPE